MALMRDIPMSSPATEGTEVKTGVLSILEKKGIKMLKSNNYQLNPLYWRLVSHAGQTYLLGYSKQVVGAKAIKTLLVEGCSIEMNIPGKVVVSKHSNETFLCIQYGGEKITFLKAESKHQRNKWVDAIRSAIQEPDYLSSTVSSTSSDSFDSFDVPRERDQRLPRSVHNTADTAPRPGADCRRVNTTPAGQFEMTNRASISSIPSSAQALAHQKRRSQEMAIAMPLQSEQSTTHPLNSADRMRGSSHGKQNNLGIYDDGAQYMECDDGEGYEDMDIGPFKPLSSSTSTTTSQLNLCVPDRIPGRVYTKAIHQAKGSNDNDYMTPLQDDQSSVSRVNNLGPESGGIYDDTAAPELPKRDYRKPTSVVQKGLVVKKSSKKTHAPKPPEVPIDQMDSIQREKTVCLETQFQRDHQPKGRDKSNEGKEGTMRGNINSEAPKGESLRTYIQRFRRELFQKDGFIVEVDKTDLSPKTMKLVCVADWICIAALPDAKLHSLLHVDDVIVKVNQQTLTSIDFCYNLFRTTDKKKVQLHVKRVMHGSLCHVILSANGDVDSLGLEFGNQIQGNEVTAMHSEGLVAKSGSPSRQQAHGIGQGGILVNWGLVEINQSPVSFDSSPADVRDQIQSSGCELALVFIPMDIINIFKERPCGESTEQTSKGEGTC